MTFDPDYPDRHDAARMREEDRLDRQDRDDDYTPAPSFTPHVADIDRLRDEASALLDDAERVANDCIRRMRALLPTDEGAR